MADWSWPDSWEKELPTFMEFHGSPRTSSYYIADTNTLRREIGLLWESHLLKIRVTMLAECLPFFAEKALNLRYNGRLHQLSPDANFHCFFVA